MFPHISEADTGIKILVDPGEQGKPSEIDIVAIHGIGAHPKDAWCKDIRNDENETIKVNWLQDPRMLPSIASTARIMTYGYKSDYEGRDFIHSNLRRVAKRLLVALAIRREECPQRPLILIGHCFGGLIIAKAINIVARSPKYNEYWIFNSIAGLVFFSTPFRGARGMPVVEMLIRAWAKHQSQNVQHEMLNAMMPGNEILNDVLDGFNTIKLTQERLEIACFYVMQEYDVGQMLNGTERRQLVVDETSGCLDTTSSVENYSLQRNHFEANKFGNPDEEDFGSVRTAISKMVNKALARQLPSPQGYSQLDLPHNHPQSAPSMNHPQQALHQGYSQSATLELDSGEPVGQHRYINSFLGQHAEHFNHKKEDYWSHLTINGLRLYEQIHDSYKNPQTGLVEYEALWEAFQGRKPAQERLKVVWSRVDAAFKPLRKDLAMAVLYMCHLELDSPEPLNTTLSSGRRSIINCFSKWVLCACGCGRKWNFANGLDGLEDKSERSTKCKAADWRDKKMLFKKYSKGKELYEQNRAAWLANR